MGVGLDEYLYHAGMFGVGVFGSAVVELLNAHKIFTRGGPFPKRYRSKWFWLVRTLVALAGGAFAAMYNPANPLLAVHIGASTPLLIATFVNTLPEEP